MWHYPGQTIPSSTYRKMPAKVGVNVNRDVRAGPGPPRNRRVAKPSPALKNCGEECSSDDGLKD